MASRSTRTSPRPPSARSAGDNLGELRLRSSTSLRIRWQAIWALTANALATWSTAGGERGRQEGRHLVRVTCDEGQEVLEPVSDLGDEPHRRRERPGAQG